MKEPIYEVFKNTINKTEETINDLIETNKDIDNRTKEIMKETVKLTLNISKALFWNERNEVLLKNNNSENQLRLFAKDMQNISVMDSDLTSDEYVDMWLNSLPD